MYCFVSYDWFIAIHTDYHYNNYYQNYVSFSIGTVLFESFIVLAFLFPTKWREMRASSCASDRQTGETNRSLGLPLPFPMYVVPLERALKSKSRFRPSTIIPSESTCRTSSSFFDDFNLRCWHFPCLLDSG